MKREYVKAMREAYGKGIKPASDESFEIIYLSLQTL